MAADTTCPNCGAGPDRVFYSSKRVPIEGLPVSRDSTTICCWWTCLDCWCKFDGAVDHKDGILPPGVLPRKKSFEQILVKT